MDSLRSQPRGDDTTETECVQLAAIYRFIFDCHAKRKNVEPAPEPDGGNDVAIVRDKEEVSDVGKRPEAHT